MASVNPLFAKTDSIEEECRMVVSVSILVSLEWVPIGVHDCTPGLDVSEDMEVALRLIKNRLFPIGVLRVPRV